MDENNRKDFEENIENHIGQTTDTSVASGDEEKKAGPSGKKKIWKILIIVLLIFAIIFGALCIRFWHVIRVVGDWDNINAYINSKKYTREDIEKKMDDNKQKMETLAQESPLIEIRGELTKEETEALKNGDITQEQAKLIVKGSLTLEEALAENGKSETPSEDSGSTEDDKPSPDDEGKTRNPDSTSSEKDKPPANDGKKPDTGLPAGSSQSPDTGTETATDKVSEIVAELYVTQADFMTRLEAIGDQAYADYKATVYDRSQIMNIVDSYTATVGALESECDKKVNGLLKELEAELNRVGGDKSMVKEIRKYYYEEKSLKKSYYLDKLDDEDYK